MKFTSIRFVAVIGVALGIATACHREAPAPPPSEWKGLSEAARPYSGRTIKILGENLPPLQSLERLRGDFERSTGIKLDINLKDHSTAIRSILAGSLSHEYDYDLVFIPHKEMGRLVATDSVLPLDQFFRQRGLRDPTFDPKKQLVQPFFDEVGTYQGRWYGLPLYLGGSIVVYRRDLAESEQERAAYRARFGEEMVVPPKTHEQWLHLAQHFYRPDAQPPLYGIALLLSDEALWYEWQSALFSFNGNVLDAKHGWEYGDVVVNSPEAIKATDFYRDLSHYAPPDAVKYSWPLGIAKMQAGVNFMTLLQYDVVNEFENPERTKLAGKFGYFLPPDVNGGCASQLESWVGFIPKSARSPEASWLLLQWMMRPDIQIQLHLEGNVSPRLSTYDDPRIRSQRPTAVILESLHCMTPKPTIPEADGIQQILTEELQTALSGKASSKAALDNAAKRIADRLGNKTKLRYPVQ